MPDGGRIWPLGDGIQREADAAGNFADVDLTTRYVVARGRLGVDGGVLFREGLMANDEGGGVAVVVDDAGGEVAFDGSGLPVQRKRQPFPDAVIGEAFRLNGTLYRYRPDTYAVEVFQLRGDRGVWEPVPTWGEGPDAFAGAGGHMEQFGHFGYRAAEAWRKQAAALLLAELAAEEENHPVDRTIEQQAILDDLRARRGAGDGPMKPLGDDDVATAQTERRAADQLNTDRRQGLALQAELDELEREMATAPSRRERAIAKVQLDEVRAELGQLGDGWKAHKMPGEVTAADITGDQLESIYGGKMEPQTNGHHGPNGHGPNGHGAEGAPGETAEPAAEPAAAEQGAE